MMIRSSCSEPLKKTVLVGAYNWRMYILILIRWAIRISQVCDLHWSHLLETTTASHDVSFLLSFSDHELYELLVVDGTILYVFGCGVKWKERRGVNSESVLRCPA